MRPRRSMVGPVILIGLGALFLINNLDPDFKIFPLFSTYWPFVLIGWGVLRLIEVLALAARGRALPQRGFSGGEVLVVILIAVIGSTSFTVREKLPQMNFGRWRVSAFGEQFDYPLTHQAAIPASATLVIDNLRGNIRITGSETTDLSLTGRTTIKAYDRKDADQANEKIPLEFRVEGDRVIIRTNQERAGENRNVSSDLEITVPKGISVEARGRYGDYDISDLQGTINIISDNAGVRLNRNAGPAKVELNRSDVVQVADLKGNLELKARSGDDLNLENIEGEVLVEGGYSGALSFRNIAKPFRFQSRNTQLRTEAMPTGSITMDLGDLRAERVTGMKLNAQSKDVSIESFTGPLEIEVRRGDIEVETPETLSAPIQVRANSGDVRMTIPSTAKFELNGKVDRGDVDNEYGDPLTKREEDRGATITGKVGSGPVIEVATQRGTLSVRKK